MPFLPLLMIINKRSPLREQLVELVGAQNSTQGRGGKTPHCLYQEMTMVKRIIKSGIVLNIFILVMVIITAIIMTILIMATIIIIVTKL